MMEKVLSRIRELRRRKSLKKNDKDDISKTASTSAEDDPRVSSHMQRVLLKCNQENVPSASDGKDVCRVCLDRAATVTGYPCGHKVMCRMCAAIMLKDAEVAKQEKITCIVCRSHVVKYRYDKPPKPQPLSTQRQPYPVCSSPKTPYEMSFRHPSESSCSYQSLYDRVASQKYAYGLLGKPSSSVGSSPESSFSN